MIVGGHSHTFMYTVNEGGKAPRPDIPTDLYPAVVETNGHKVLIVQASAYMKYVGNLTVYFDTNGNVAEWHGNPIYLDANITPGLHFFHLTFSLQLLFNFFFLAIKSKFKCRS